VEILVRGSISAHPREKENGEMSFFVNLIKTSIPRHYADKNKPINQVNTAQQ